MNAEKRQKIFKRLQENNPYPSTELIYHSTFELLIAVILSAQATDKSVNKATKKLFPVANTPEKLLQLGEDNLKKYIKTIGLYNSKAKNIIQTCQDLITQHQSQVPNTRAALKKLPGVGQKTANVILNTAFGQNTIAVDTHIFRVANRTHIATGKDVIEVEKKLLRHVPTQYKQHAHHWLILHGRYICIARKPRCNACLISDLCEYKDKYLDNE